MCYALNGDIMREFKWNNVDFKITDIGGGRLGEDIPEHAHALNSYELHFITGGAGRVQVEGREYPLKKGDFFITGPNVRHSHFTDPQNKTEDIFVTVYAENPKKANMLSSAFLKTDFFFCENFDLSPAEKMLKEYRAKKPDYQSAVAAYCQIILTQILRAIPVPDIKAEETEEPNLNEKRFVIIEQAFLFDKDITLSSLSEKIGLCERQTQRLLKKYYSMTFRQKKKESSAKK